MAGTIDVETLRARLDGGERISILDVREPDDFVEWRIPGALHCNAFDDLQAKRAGKVATFDLLRHDRPVVTVCYEGNSSAFAAEVLRDRGFDARSLEGGMTAWTTAWNSALVSLPGSDAHVIQIRRSGKGCLSYVVASGDDAIVIDPSVDIHVYTDLAKQRGWTIRRILETHVHADHLTRAPALARATGATLMMPRNDRVTFPYEPLDEGARITLGKHELVALHTPGHTKESMCYHLDGRALFTGDTLFLGHVGRPDLVTDRAGATSRALSLHHSLQRLFAMPGDTLVLPCHTSAPIAFDHRPLVAELRQVRARVPLLALERDEFVARVLERLPPTPPSHVDIVKANESGDSSRLEVPRVEAGPNRCAASG